MLRSDGLQDRNIKIRSIFTFHESDVGNFMRAYDVHVRNFHWMIFLGSLASSLHQSESVYPTDDNGIDSTGFDSTTFIVHLFLINSLPLHHGYEDLRLQSNGIRK